MRTEEAIKKKLNFLIAKKERVLYDINPRDKSHYEASLLEILFLELEITMLKWVLK